MPHVAKIFMHGFETPIQEAWADLGGLVGAGRVCQEAFCCSGQLCTRMYSGYPSICASG